MLRKNGLIFLIMVLILVPFVFAEIKIEPIEAEDYNLGDTVDVKTTIKETDYLTGMLTHSINCGDYALTYAVTPLILEYDVEKEIDTSLLLIGRMGGGCEIIAGYESLDGLFTEEERSNIFTVSSELSVEILMDKNEFLPQEDIVIAGTVKTKSGENVDGVTMTINFQNKDYLVDVKGGKIAIKIEVLASMNSGTHNMLFMVEDKNGNSKEIVKGITITAVASRLRLELDKKDIDPLESVAIVPFVHDQSDSPIADTVVIEIIDSKRRKVASEDIPTNIAFNYVAEPSSVPGEYTVKVSKDRLKKEENFVVNEIEDIDVQLEGNLVIIKNIGNVVYKDATTIVLESEDNKYILNRKLNLKPGEVLEIDLSKEVKEDVYDISIPTSKDGSRVIEDAKISDNRGVIKKVGQGLGGITGFSTAAKAKGSNKGYLAFIAIIIIIVVIVGYFWKGPGKGGNVQKGENVDLGALEQKESESVSEFKDN